MKAQAGLFSRVSMCSVSAAEITLLPKSSTFMWAMLHFAMMSGIASVVRVLY